MEPSTPKKRGPLLVSLLAVLTLVVGVTAATSLSSSASALKHPAVVKQAELHPQTQLVAQHLAAETSNNCHGSVSDGPGIMASGHDNVGLELFCGRAWVCISPLLGLNASQGFGEIARLTGTSTETSRRIWYLLYEYIPRAMHLDNTGHHKAADYTAAALRIAVNKLVGKSANLAALKRWKRAVPTSVYDNGTDKAHNHLQYLAKQLHGPYKLTVKLSGSLQPSTPRTLSGHLTAASGASVPGKTMAFSVSGGVLSRSRATTSHAGNASTTLTPYKVGTVAYTVSVAGLASTHGLLSKPGYKQQQLLSQAPGISLKKPGSGTSRFPGVKLTVKCPANCQPTHVPVVSSPIPNTSKSTWYATLTGERVVGGKTVTVNYGKKAVKAGTKPSLTWYASNGDTHLKVTLSATFDKHTATQVVGTLSLVLCKPELPVGVRQDFTCDCQDVIVESGVNKSGSTVTVEYSDNMGNHATYSVPDGQSLAPQTEKVHGSQVSWKLVVTTPNATGNGKARVVTITGTTTVTVS